MNNHAPQIIQNALFNLLPGIGHAFFTRHGGVSKGIYEGLNCAEESKDNPEHVAQNRQLALIHLGIEKRSLASYHAKHGNKAVIMNQTGEFEEADAVITNNPALVLGADSADCPTVLLADPNARVIGLAHAGWRSAHSGILEATLEQMQALGASNEHITAVIGPGIAQVSYEVSQSFYLQFCEESAQNAAHFTPSHRMSHWMFNLPGYIHARLQRQGLNQIHDVALNTYALKEQFYSCRRSFHQGQEDFGGHFACLYLG